MNDKLSGKGSDYSTEQLMAYNEFCIQQIIDRLQEENKELRAQIASWKVNTRQVKDANESSNK